MARNRDRIILIILLGIVIFLFLTGRKYEGFDTTGVGCYSDDHCSPGEQCCGGSEDGISGLGTCCAGKCVCEGGAEFQECTCVPIDL